MTFDACSQVAASQGKRGSSGNATLRNTKLQVCVHPLVWERGETARLATNTCAYSSSVFLTAHRGTQMCHERHAHTCCVGATLRAFTTSLFPPPSVVIILWPPCTHTHTRAGAQRGSSDGRGQHGGRAVASSASLPTGSERPAFRNRPRGHSHKCAGASSSFGFVGTSHGAAFSLGERNGAAPHPPP